MSPGSAGPSSPGPAGPAASLPGAPATGPPARSPLPRRLLWGFLAAALVAVAVVFVVTRAGRTAPPEPLPILSEVPPFELTNRDGRPVGRADLLGAPWIADLVFTRCVLACPVMSARLAALDAELPRQGEGGAPAVRLVSISVDPEHDRPAVLAEYAFRFHASDRWLFLTGAREELVKVGGDGLRLGFDPNPPLVPLAPGDNIYHSTRFVLVDGAARVRGYYDSQDPADLDRLRGDVRALLAAGG